MAVKLSPLFNDAMLDASGNPLSGGKLYTYAAGSTTAQTAYQDSAGATPHANPIVLNSRGEPPAPIWLTSGQTYKFDLQTAASVSIRTIDNVSGVNDTSVSIDQWVSGPAPTYISATSFSLAGDQTSTFHVGRRIKTTNSGGTVYSTITASAYASVTTVTVANDSGTLDSGLSAVAYGLLSYSNPSVPNVFWTTGDVKLTLKTVADAGWVLMDDKTIGNASSSATGRANADTSALYTLLWNNTADAQCAVSTGRGASAAADFAAQKTIALPKALGRALAVYGSGSGLSARALALALGDENMQAHTHTGTTGAMNSNSSHTHGVSGAGNVASGASIASTPNNSGTFGATDGTNTDHTHNFTTGSTGAGGAQNMQPTVFLNVMIKL